MPFHNNQYLPSSGPERELLREKGQFWTPQWVSDAMVSYVLLDNPGHIFDPAVGGGVFFKSAKDISRKKNQRIELLGTEIDSEIFLEGTKFGLIPDDFKFVELRDFILDTPKDHYKAIVANPPYIRHHRLTDEYKNKFKIIAKETIGFLIDGRAGIHIYFLLQSLRLLQPCGRLAFIMPSDTVEGVFSKDLWKWITQKYCLEAVVTFNYDATPFPTVDTNAIIFFIQNLPPKDHFFWARCTKSDSQQLKYWVNNNFQITNNSDINIVNRNLNEGLRTGLSRPPRCNNSEELPLINFATVTRGIATGENDYFLLTIKKAEELGIPNEYLLTAISKTRDVKKDIITAEDIHLLEERDIPTLLFSPDGRPIDQFPDIVKKYLLHGEEIGLPKKALISQRKPWYKMEKRKIPPILFTYLGRRNCRFVLNDAKAVPLTGFLCVYPKRSSEDYIKSLYNALNHPDTINNLSLVGKSYGSGAIKVEPRALERLPIPLSVIKDFGLSELIQKELF